MPDPKITPQLQANLRILRDASGQRFGILKSVLREGLKRNKEIYEAPADIPHWSE
jgi:hypothetical protein